MTVNNDGDAPADVIWGCARIAKVIGRSERSTFHLLGAGLLPAKKIGRAWVASRAKLLATLTGDEQ